MNSKNITFNCGAETLVGTFCEVDHPQGQVLMLHGAGSSTRERTKYLADYLGTQGVSSFRIDFSGHGESSGKLEESSLEKRVLEAKEAYQVSGFSESVSVIGSSMSGHVAIKLTEHIPVSNLILFCPAIYPAEAYSVAFNAGFSEIIRKENSWVDSDCFEILARFTGKILVIIGTEDTVIPSGVIEKLEASLHGDHQKVVRLAGASHAIHAWLQEKPEIGEEVEEMISEFISVR